MRCRRCDREVERTGTRGPAPTLHPQCKALEKREREEAKFARREELAAQGVPWEETSRRRRELDGPPPRRTGMRDPAKRERVLELLEDGASIEAAAKQTQSSPDTVTAIVRQVTGLGGRRPPADREAAARALEDFGFFRRRYFGRVETPWQTEAGGALKELLATPDKEYVVLNAPPGSGKSTLFCHDMLVWLACRDRSVRVLVGSRTYRQAVTYTNRLRRTFSRQSLAPVDSDDILRGLAVEPEGVLAHDYGRFHPLGRSEQWAAGEFVLVQPDGTTVTEKESSFAAYGMDSGFLGGRYDVVVWDDLIDRKTLRTADAREQLVRTYEDEMETRVEPGGLLVLQGQRMAADDLYRHALDMKAGDPDEDEEARPRKYHHIVYRAHDEARCEGPASHGPAAPAWPGGCLLDPKRLPWRELATVQANRAEKYMVLYQQEDVDPQSVLVPHVWVDGGTDPVTGELHPGCWDRDRGLCEVPRGLPGPWASVATADPSAARFWSVQHWLVSRTAEQYVLLDCFRDQMQSTELLDYDVEAQRFTGLMEEWQQRSVQIGAPITHWVVEANAAQRFLLQYNHVKRWQALHKVAILPHQTHLNKNNQDLGVQTIGTHFKFGRVRLPGKEKPTPGSAPGRQAAMNLVREVTRWPSTATEDAVLACWFLFWNLDVVAPKVLTPPTPAQRPTWLVNA